jgi:hypothetical protein
MSVIESKLLVKQLKSRRLKASRAITKCYEDDDDYRHEKVPRLEGEMDAYDAILELLEQPSDFLKAKRPKQRNSGIDTTEGYG